MIRHLTHALLVGTSLVASATVCAQTAPAADSTGTGTTQAATGNASGGIGDIVVTANRVESASQKTATALTVYSGADLVSRGVTNVASLATIDPSINVVSSTGSAYVALRGIASTDVTEIGDPAVPIARDGFYTNRSYSIQATMYDLSRVEVLKGPQGTLNGRNSTGGLISVITNRPEFRNGGYADLGVGNYGAFHEETGFNLVLSDTLAIRASDVYDYHSGYRTVAIQSNGQTERGDDSNVASGRIQIAWNPSPDIKLWASYQHDSTVGVGDVATDTPLAVVPPTINAKSFVNGSPTSVHLTGDRVRWEVRDDALPAGLRFIYSGGYDVEDWKHALDFGPLVNGVGGTGYPAYQQFLQHEHPKTWNHEVRFSNDPHSRLFVQAGWFHFQESNAIESGVFDGAMTGPFAPGGPLAGLSQTGNYGIFFPYPAVTDRSDAGFAYLTYTISDALKLSAGARETWDHKTRVGSSILDLAALVSPFIPAGANPPPVPNNGDVSEKQPTFHIGLDWNPTSHNLVYAKFDTGYKAGGFNSNGSAPPVPYGAEKVSTAEIGSKNRFFDNKLQLNVDGFYTHYTGYQGSQNLPSLSGAAGVFNVGNANIYGAEAQIIALFGDGGQIDLNATALHTKFTDRSPGSTPCAGANVASTDICIVNGAGNSIDVSGNRLPNAPGLSFNAGLQQAVDVAGGRLTGRVEAKYSSSYYFSVFNTPDTEQHDFLTGNISVTYKPDHGGWKLEAYVRNVTDKVVFANATQGYTGGYNSYEFQPPRTFGVTGSVKF